MAIPTKIIDFLFGARDDLNSEHKAQHDEPVSPPQGGQSIDRSITPYDPIISSIKLAWQRLARVILPAHLQVAPDDVLYLERIEISAMDEDAKLLLAQFMHEFRQQNRIDFVRQQLGRDLKNTLVLRHFTGICDNAADKVDVSPAADAFDRILAGGSVHEAIDKFEVRLIGHWGEKPVSQPVQSTAKGHKGMKLNLTLWDGFSPQGRSLSVDSYPLHLCRKEGTGADEDGQLLIAGTYVSSLHGVLNSDGMTVTISDGPSRNGLWLNGARLQANEKAPLKEGDWLRFSTSEDKDVSRYPRLRIDALQCAAGSTPVTTPVAGATPPTAGVTPPINSSRVWAQLTIVDATGSRQVDVTQLPFSIGRSHEMNYVIPEGNAGVSREHLLITEINEQGALVVHPKTPTHGTCKVGFEKTMLPVNFLWLYGESILLAPNYPKSQPVKLTLRKVI